MNHGKTHIAILGSTGSIGTQALEVIRNHSDLFEVEALTAWSNYDLLIRQAIEFRPNVVVIGKADGYRHISESLQHDPVKVFSGAEAITQVVEMQTIDVVLCAMVGFSGLEPTLNAIRCGKRIALANKEVLVVAGELVMEEVARNRILLLPVDSEHSAIFQCLLGEPVGSVEKIFLTASGGPFRGLPWHHLSQVTREAALKHPNWKMGNKITIDSATLMNKGLEVIEAHWLFDLKPGQIDVIIHPQSVIHSIVQFCDGSMKAQMGIPNMRLPILYALGYPERITSPHMRFSFLEYPALTFEPPDRELFRSLDLAYYALEQGGNMPCMLNAANEAVVHAFLEEKIGFIDMPEIIETCLLQVHYIPKPSLGDYYQTHSETMVRAKEIIKKTMKLK